MPLNCLCRDSMRRHTCAGTRRETEMCAFHQVRTELNMAIHTVRFAMEFGAVFGGAEAVGVL